MLLKQPSENVVVFRQKNCWAQIYDMLINEDPLGQVKFVKLLSYCVKFACDYDEARD